jgi:ribosome-associated translation inhibitor RaiA
VPIQVAAHGFEITESLRNTCVDESKDKLQSLAQHNFSARWSLSIERGEHIAHINWGDGEFHGDASARSSDMYGSIRLCTKKVMEQMKKAHGKAYEPGRRSGKHGVGTAGSAEGEIMGDEE